MAGGKVREIKRRIKGVKNTHQITKAMDIVSSTKFKKFNELVMNARPYSGALENILKNIASGLKGERHPLFDGVKNPKKIGLIVITSDRGLCGSYNSSILREMTRFIETHPDKEISVIAVGKKIRDFCRKKDIDMKAEYTQLIPEIMFEKAKEIGENIVEFFYEGIYDEVYVIYSKFISAMSSEILTKKMLPVERVEATENVSYIFEPSEEAILDTLLPKYLNIALYQQILESTASEHSARMRAMKSATDNAEDMISKLSLKYNRARQATITQELSEIVGGANALQ